MEKEDTPKGEVAEQAKEEISEPVSTPASKEEKATSEKEDQWRRDMQSRTDKAEHAAKVATEQLQKLQERERQRVLEERQREIEKTDEPEEQAKLKRKYELEDAIRANEEKIAQQESAVGRKYDQALELASKYNLGLADARELMKAETPKEMELLAQLKVKDLEKETKTSEEIQTPKPDSNISDAGTDTDAAFLKSWNAGDIPATKENIERAKKIINK